MARKRWSVRRIKRLRAYRIEEVAAAVGVHKRTIQNWVKEGLPLIDQNRPQLVRGSDLISFHEQRHAHRKQRCLPGQLYCLKCKRPQFAAEGFAYFQPGTDGTAGNLSAICKSCGSIVNRRVSNRKLVDAKGNLDVTVVEPETHKRVVPAPLNL